MTKQEKHRIPAFSDYEEEAEFWDTHDFGDYWDETEPVTVKFSKNLSENLTVRLSPEALALLRRQADQMGIGPSTLPVCGLSSSYARVLNARPDRIRRLFALRPTIKHA